MDNEALRVAEVSAILHLSRSATYAAVQRGEIPSIRIGQAIRVPRVALEELLRNAGKETTAAGVQG